MKDKEFLYWIADRLVYKYGEDINVDFVVKLRSIAIRIGFEQETEYYAIPTPIESEFSRDQRGC